jgi:hypothetical protein
MTLKTSDPYEVTYQVHEKLSLNNRYIEALTPVFETAEAVVLKRRDKETKVDD